MLDMILGPVAIAGAQGIQGPIGPVGPTGPAGPPGNGTATEITWTAFPSVGSAITNTTASVPTTNAAFYVDFSQFGSNIDIYMSCIGKIGAAAYAGGVSAWASTNSSTDNPCPSPYSGLSDTMLALIEFPLAGTSSNYVGKDTIVTNIDNPGGKQYVLITSFAGATTSLSDVGSIS